MLVKSSEARQFVKLASLLAPMPLSAARLAGAALITHPNERRDADAELLWDAIQGKAYQNDRCVREKHIYHRTGEDVGVAFALWPEANGAEIPRAVDLAMLQTWLKGGRCEKDEGHVRREDRPGAVGLYRLEGWDELARLWSAAR